MVTLVKYRITHVLHAILIAADVLVLMSILVLLVKLSMEQSITWSLELTLASTYVLLVNMLTLLLIYV
jgi:hypothetical protein